MIDLLKTRRSIRKYKDKEIEKEKIDTLLKAALLSPSSKGRRPWEFIAVTDKNLLEGLSQSREFGSQFLKGASLAIVVLADKNIDVWVEDASIAATILHLTAHSMGLGSCWVQVHERMHTETETTSDYIKKLLDIPEKYNVECMVSIGYPDEEKKPYEDKDLLYDKLHFNKF